MTSRVRRRARARGSGHRRRMEALAAEATEPRDRVRAAPARTPAIAAVAATSWWSTRTACAPTTARSRAPVWSRRSTTSRAISPSISWWIRRPARSAPPHRRARRVLAGSAYALVPPLDARVIEAPVDAPVDRVLVTTGAADAGGIGARDRRVARRRASPTWRCGSSSGPGARPTFPRGVVPVHAPDGLAVELAAAGIVVTAGGVALLEACVLGRPIVALALAGNQRQAVRRARAASARSWSRRRRPSPSAVTALVDGRRPPDRAREPRRVGDRRRRRRARSSTCSSS